MWWPSPSDYQDAVQNPRAVFSEAELRDGVVVCDTLGLPKPISGSFATVYQVDYQGRRHAVRCFLRHVPDIAQRYAAISAYLKKSALPYTVEFSFLPQGIRLRGQWFPIVKMDWVEGNRLDVYIAQHLNDSAALLEITRQFLQLADALRRANIAHGDLQHGNLLVVNHQLRLLDYDGMFVPTLAGRPSNELGQPNYQHPLRTARDYGAYLDNFSVWVISLSLLGMALDPDLRFGFAGGGEALLLQQSDYANPANSKILAAMLQSPHPTLRFLTQSFTKFLYARNLNDVPPLEPNAIAALYAASPARVNLPDWLRERMVVFPHDANPPSQSAPAPVAPPLANNADWLLDHIQPPETPRLQGTFLAEKSLLGLFVLALGFILGVMLLTPIEPYLVAAMLAVVPLTGVITLALGFSLRYNSPERRDAEQNVNTLERERAQLEAQLQTLTEHRTKMDREQQEKLAHLKRQEAQVNSRRQADLAVLDRELQNLTARYDARRKQIADQESVAMQAALQEFQTTTLERLLSAFRIADAMLPGIINREMKQRLAAYGFVTAADVVNFQVTVGKDGPRFCLVNRQGKIVYVRGMNAKQGVPLILWRRNKEANVKRLVPAVLPAEIAMGVSKKFQDARISVQLEELKKKQTLEQEKTRLTEKARVEQTRITREIQELPAQSRQTITRAEQELAQLRKALAEKEWGLVLAKRNLAAYAHINFSNYLKAIFGR